MPGVRSHARARLAGGVDRLDERQLGQRAHERGRIGGGGDDVEVLDGVGLAAQRAGDLDALGAGHGAQRVDDLLGDRQRAREQDARRRRAVVAGRELLEQLLLDLRAEAAQAAQLLLLGGAAQRLERVDAELVVEPARALGPEAGQVHHRDHAARELRAQLLRLRRVAGLDQRLELRLERLADARPARSRGRRARAARRTRRPRARSAPRCGRRARGTARRRRARRGRRARRRRRRSGRSSPALAYAPGCRSRFGDEVRATRRRPRLGRHARHAARLAAASARRPSRPWVAGSLAVALLLLLATWIVATLTMPGDSARCFAGVGRGRVERLRLHPVPQRARAGAARDGVRGGLHGRLLAADRRRGLQRLVAPRARPRGHGSRSRSWPPRRLFSLTTQAYALGIDAADRRRRPRHLAGAAAARAAAARAARAVRAVPAARRLDPRQPARRLARAARRDVRDDARSRYP